MMPHHNLYPEPDTSEPIAALLNLDDAYDQWAEQKAIASKEEPPPMLDLDRIKILMDRTNAVIFGFSPQGTSYQDSKRLWYALEALIARVHELEAVLGEVSQPDYLGRTQLDAVSESLELRKQVAELKAERNRLASDVAMLRPGAERASDAVERAAALTLELEHAKMQLVGVYVARERLRAALQNVIIYASTGTDEEVAAWRVAREVLGDWRPS